MTPQCQLLPAFVEVCICVCSIACGPEWPLYTTASRIYSKLPCQPPALLLGVGVCWGWACAVGSLPTTVVEMRLEQSAEQSLPMCAATVCPACWQSSMQGALPQESPRNTPGSIASSRVNTCNCLQQLAGHVLHLQPSWLSSASLLFTFPTLDFARLSQTETVCSFSGCTEEQYWSNKQPSQPGHAVCMISMFSLARLIYTSAETTRDPRGTSTCHNGRQ